LNKSNPDAIERTLSEISISEEGTRPATRDSHTNSLQAIKETSFNASSETLVENEEKTPKSILNKTFDVKIADLGNAWYDTLLSSH